ncbi:hypothetical protein [Burkholderia territorii]|uniref:hypothetical protein n=1 Tax=Burkholderia territorii TaxID=1503055 RepID=UPI000A8D7849|nr:hypothetical protein [Burkholderia territorii]
MVWIGDDLQTRAVANGQDLWSLCDPTSAMSLPIDIQQELAAWLSSAPRYADEEVWPDGFDDSLIQIENGEPADNPDLAWAHHHVRAGRPVACLSLLRDAPAITTSSHGEATVFWVQSEPTHKAFWRAAIDLERDTEATLKRLAPHAFPDLHFHTGVWDQVRSFAGGYDAVRERLRAYLIALDDYGRWAFTCPPPALHPDEAVPNGAPQGLPSNQIIERRFVGFALTMAPENPDVYLDRRCREAREITIGARTLYCGWHAKLEPHRNRIHIHPPVRESANKLIIAIFDEHLPLPGHH